MVFTPTAIGGIAIDRFGVKKNAEYLWLPEIVNASLVPTEAEVNAGASLTCAIEGLNGFGVTARYDELADLCSDIDGKVFAGSSLDDTSISFYMAEDEDDALDFFTEGDQGYLIHAPNGLAGGSRAWVYKAEVSAVSPTVATTGGSMGTVAFAIMARERIALPATAS